MKNTILFLLLLPFASTSLMANEFNGSRIGAGFGWAAADYDSYSTWYDGRTGDGISVTYGYDFNRVVGLNINYQKNDGTVDKSEFSGSTYSLDLDIGWAFTFDSWSLKPYGALGFGKHSQDIKQYLGTSCSYGVCKHEFNEESIDGSGLSLGFGVRAQMNNGLYVELRDDALLVDSDSISGRTALIGGYKF